MSTSGNPRRREGGHLEGYVDRFRLTVQRYFPVPAGSAAQAFVHVAGHYPVFEPSNNGRERTG
jgi:hypothetical protein